MKYFPLLRLVTLIGAMAIYAIPGWATTCPGDNWGDEIASYRGQKAYSNGTNHECYDGSSTYGYRYQCVEYVKRFYGEVMHFPSTGWGGHAGTFYGQAEAFGLRNFVQGGPDAPKENDLLCFSGGTYGHVAIISDVNLKDKTVTIIDQNWTTSSTEDPRTLTMSESTDHRFTVHSMSTNYPVQGWLRGYLCDYYSQTPSGVVNLAPGQPQLFKVKYTNTSKGNAPNWLNVEGDFSIELRSCDDKGAGTTCFLEPVPGQPAWLDPANRIRIVAPVEANTGTNEIATFQFWGQVPIGTPNGDYPVYFRPFHHAGQWIESWRDMHFTIHVTSSDVTPPTVPTPVTVNPTGCSQTNSFTFSWNPSTDTGGSGLAGYQWNLDGSENVNPAPSSPVATLAPAAGSYTFFVRAVDGAGNRSGFASVGFCYQPPTGPCGTREIPRCWNPPHGPDHCIPPASAQSQPKQ